MELRICIVYVESVLLDLIFIYMYNNYIFLDVVFMIDKSTSLNSTEFDKSLQFVHDVIQLLDIGLSDTLASLVTVSTPPTEIFDLKDYTDKSDYLQAVNNLMGSGTSGDGNIKRGLNFVWENSFKTSPFNRTDPEPERVVILLSSTVTTDNAAGTVAVADKIRTDYNASIFTLGVGPGVYAQNTELRGVANDPDANFTHFVDTFDDLWCVVPIIVAKIGYIIIFIGYVIIYFNLINYLQCWYVPCKIITQNLHFKLFVRMKRFYITKNTKLNTLVTFDLIRHLFVPFNKMYYF